MNRNSRLLFQRSWQANGSPTLDVIDPVSDWTLPAGIVYDPAYQSLMNGATAVAPDNYWTKSTLPYIPLGRSQTTNMMIMSGVLPDSTAEVEVWSEDVTELDGIFGIGLNGYVYRIVSRSPSAGSGAFRLVLERKR